MNKKRPYQVNRLTSEQKELLTKYVEANPNNNYTQFVEDIKGKVKCSDSHFYIIRRKILGIARQPRGSGRTPIYLTVWSYPTDKLDDKAREVLKDFIETLNGLRRSRFQLVEMKDPAIIEVRESHVRS